MNRRQLVGHIAEELGRVLPDGDADLDADDLESVDTCVEQVLKDAEEAIDADAEEEEEEKT